MKVIPIGIALAAWLLWKKRTRAMAVLLVSIVVAAALQDSAMITGLEFENYKWGHVAVPACYLAFVLAFIELLARRGEKGLVAARNVIGVAVVLVGVIAIVIIPAKWLHFGLAPEMRRQLAESLPLRKELAGLDPGALLSLPDNLLGAAVYTRGGLLFTGYHTFQSLIPDEEVIRRWTLQQVLMGEDRTKALADWPTGIPDHGVYGENRPRWSPEVVHGLVAKYYDAANPADYRAMGVRYALLPSTLTPSPRSGQWHPLQSTGEITLWEVQNP